MAMVHFEDRSRAEQSSWFGAPTARSGSAVPAARELQLRCPASLGPAFPNREAHGGQGKCVKLGVAVAGVPLQ